MSTERTTVLLGAPNIHSTKDIKIDNLSLSVKSLSGIKNPHSIWIGIVQTGILQKIFNNLSFQDLSWSSNLTELSQSGRPLSVLYDMLVRPGADMGSEIPGSIQWELNRTREVPHIVIGETKIGGSWNEYDPEMLTVSFSDWMDMPGLTMEQWLGGRPMVKR